MATLQITKKLHIPPFIDIQSTTFAKRYVSGVHWRLFGWRVHGEIVVQDPLPEHYLIDNLKLCARLNRFDGDQDEPLRADLGFFLGMLHGGVLTPDGTLRPDANTLVIIHTHDFREAMSVAGVPISRRMRGLSTRKTTCSICSKCTLRITSTWAESKAHCVGRLAVRLENSPGDSSHSPNRNNSGTSIPRSRSSI